MQHQPSRPAWGQVGVGVSALAAQNVSTFAFVDSNVAHGSGKATSVSAGFKVVWQRGCFTASSPVLLDANQAARDQKQVPSQAAH